jgi:NAD(P)-dependent dehydrogenase (short-subunit alcohol dehydrogenase family)
MRDLAGKVAVITGAASGIGRALAGRCAAEGMRLALADIEAPALERTAAELRAGGAEVLAVRTDVSCWEDMAALARSVSDAFGAAHLVCNNAGVAVCGTLWETRLADWRWVLGVNLWGVIHGVRAFTPMLLAQKEGHIVNTASIQGLITHHPLSASYQTSKHAVLGLSEQLHYELAGTGVGVSVLCPGWVRTQIADACRNRPDYAPISAPGAFSPAQEETLEQCASALRRGDDPERMAAAVLAAVREERFYVLPHPQWLPYVRARMAGILDGRTPGAAPVDVLTCAPDAQADGPVGGSGRGPGG